MNFCPHGCGTDITKQPDAGYCFCCRRSFSAPPEIYISEDVDIEVLSGFPEEKDAAYRLYVESLGDSMVLRKASWCWQWFGPVHHRMRCRLKIGHDGDHYDHELRRQNCITVDTDGVVIG